MNIQKIPLITYKNNPSFDEESQFSPTLFSFLKEANNGFEEIHKRVKCREFLNDAVVDGLLQKTLPKIYNFEMDELIDTDKTLLSFTFPREDLTRVLYNLKLIKIVDEISGIYESTIYSTEPDIDQGDDCTLIIVGSKDWISSPLAISIYSFFIRLCWYDLGKFESLEEAINNFKNNSEYSDPYVNCNEFRLLSKIEISNFEILLKTFIEITRENPITGINDSELKENLNNQYLSPYDELKISINDMVIRWAVKYSHAYLGFSSVLQLTSYLKGRQYPQIGFQWAVNLNKYLIEL